MSKVIIDHNGERKRLVKRPKESWYKKWADLSDMERATEVWNRKGQPRVFWPTMLAKTYDKHDPNCQETLKIIKEQRAEVLQNFENKIKEAVNENTGTA